MWGFSGLGFGRFMKNLYSRAMSILNQVISVVTPFITIITYERP